MIKRFLGYVVVAVFTVGFLGGGVLALVGVYRQSRTANWPTAAEAAVTASSVVHTHDGYEPSIDYRYRVGAAWQTSSTIRRSGAVKSSDDTYARETVARFPVGSATVFVNPGDPADSVLVQGIDGHEVLKISFAFPFVAVGSVFLLCTIVWLLRGRRGYIGRVRVFDPSPGVTVVRDNALTPLMMGALCTSGVAFIGVFLVQFVFQAWPIIAVPTHFLLAAAAGVAGFVLRRRWLREGRSDTVIDDGAGVLIPARARAAAAETIPLADIRACETITEETRDKDGQTSTSLWTGVRNIHANEPRKLVRHYAEQDAERFTSWLTERLRVGERGTQGGQR
ncbi:MAG: DUF3592 domain-containing protein [Phycisphaerales bacterium]